MDAYELLQNLIYRGITNTRYKRSKIPGELIKHLNDENKKIIQSLKSNDIAPGKVRDHQIWCWDDTYTEQKLLKKLELDFDKKIGVAR